MRSSQQNVRSILTDEYLKAFVLSYIKYNRDCMGETTKIREIAAKYCVGKGVDLGCGADKITPGTWGFDLPEPYFIDGNDRPEMKGDARILPFNDGVLDYVYSSHLLEDFPNTDDVVNEWLRVLKLGGKLILYMPNEQKYRRYCEATGQVYNLHHAIAEMSLDYMKEVFFPKSVKIIDGLEEHADYSFFIVVEKSR